MLERFLFCEGGGRHIRREYRFPLDSAGVVIISGLLFNQFTLFLSTADVQTRPSVKSHGNVFEERRAKI